MLNSVLAAFAAYPLTYGAAVIALLSYVPLCYVIVKKGMKQNLVTFILWCLFDAVAAIAAFREGGNWQLPAFYTLGCLAVIAAIWQKRIYAIGRIEILFGALALVCFLLWFIVGDTAAIVVSTLALGLATVPQLKDVWLKPQTAPLLPYLGFLTANVMSTFAGTAWTIEERLYPAGCVVATLLYVLFAGRRYLRKEA